MAKILTVYYSRKGENYWNGSIKNISKGNTERIAEFIQEAVGGDLFEVDTVYPYDKDYYKCIDEAKKELHNNARPKIKAYPENFEKYEIIFVGYPNWWGTMPMCMFTLLEKYDLTGKIIIPFCTNEGSGMGSSEHDLKKICKGAIIKNGLSIHGAESENARIKVSAWAKKSI
ncbi:MAG: flavodoxin [Oscillospiraceae bacterium]|nr:flavodoxin [Oscillospiraceae bacterium]